MAGLNSVAECAECFNIEQVSTEPYVQQSQDILLKTACHAL